ncbi:MAG: BspA family leucine-rich repeat surface protein [Clostridia bacterium]|nr:BspA family leucine-rich repeat surface protein [Clostridia bacterium]
MDKKIGNCSVKSTNDGTRARKWKYALYFFLFSLCIFTGSAVITMAAMTGGVGNSFNVIYTAPKDPATLITGEEFVKALKLPENSSATYYTSDSTIKSITFDYYGSEYNDVINNASVTTDVASTSSAGDAIMYHVGDSTNGYDVYVLSEGDIIVNATSSYMFYECRGITSIIFNNFDTSSVTDMSGMFYYTGLTALDVSAWDTSSVTNMGSMFDSCSSLTTLDLSGWGTRSVTKMSFMFYNCSGLTKIYVGSGWNTASVTNGSNMFTGCISIVGGNGTTYSSSNMTHTYARVDTASTPGYLTNKEYAEDGDDTGGGDDTGDWGYVEINCGADVSYAICGGAVVSGDNWNEKVQSITFGAYEDYASIVSGVSTSAVNSLVSLDSPILRTPPILGGGAVDGGVNYTDISINGDGSVAVYRVANGSYYDVYILTKNKNRIIKFNEDCSNMFKGLTVLADINFNGIVDTSAVTDMEGMFDGCSGLTTLDLSGWDTSSVTTVSFMFAACSRLTTIYVDDKWSTVSVTSGVFMFMGCGELVGGNGTKMNISYRDHTYARVDTASTPGYLTLKS